MGFAMSFILGLFLRIFQFISFYLRFFAYFLTKSPQTFEACELAPVFVESPRTITSGLLTDDRSNLIKIASQFVQKGGDL